MAFFENFHWTDLLFVPAALLAIMFHEVAHGWAAYKLGDVTAKEKGRLSLNPIRHIDIIGLLMLVFFRFGWAKPVPVDMRYFKKPRRDFALTALAGPVSNFLQAIVALLLCYACVFLYPQANALFHSDIIQQDFLMYFPILIGASQHGIIQLTIVDCVMIFLYFSAMLNVGLGVFNLFPIPPLDGSKIFGIVIPDHIYYRILPYERYGMLLLVALLYLGWLSGPLGFLRDAVLSGLNWVAYAPFRLFFGG